MIVIIAGAWRQVPCGDNVKHGTTEPERNRAFVTLTELTVKVIDGPSFTGQMLH